MAQIKVSELPTASNFNDDDYTMIVQNNTSKKIAKENLNMSYKYSTSEIVVGKWIDNKPIYRKVINTNSLLPDPADMKTIPHGISNMDKVVGLKCIADTGSGTYFDFNNFVGLDENEDFPITIRVWIDNTNVYIQNGAFLYYVDDAYITIEYTKTTD